MLKLSFAGNKEGLLEYIKFAEWAEKDCLRVWGTKVENIFSDLSGYTSTSNPSK